MHLSYTGWQGQNLSTENSLTLQELILYLFLKQPTLWMFMKHSSILLYPKATKLVTLTLTLRVILICTGSLLPYWTPTPDKITELNSAKLLSYKVKHSVPKLDATHAS